MWFGGHGMVMVMVMDKEKEKGIGMEMEMEMEPNDGVETGRQSEPGLTLILSFCLLVR